MARQEVTKMTDMLTIFLVALFLLPVMIGFLTSANLTIVIGGVSIDLAIFAGIGLVLLAIAVFINYVQKGRSR